MIVYSRFNCRQFALEGNPSSQVDKKDVARAVRRMNNLRFDEAWLQRRLNLFNTFTVPSVMGQTNQKFHWVGIAHPDSPKWFLDELAKVSRMELQLHVWDVNSRKVPHHTTVNLDTDDALSRDFIERARNVNFEGETIFPRGMRYRIQTQCWITSRTDNAHFNIVRHPKWTVLDFSHGMGAIEKNIVDHRRPMWLEIIHEENIANKLCSASASKNMGAKFAERYFDLDYGRIKHDY